MSDVLAATLSTAELRQRLTKWSSRGLDERAARLSACLERCELEKLFDEVLAEGKRKREAQQWDTHESHMQYVPCQAAPTDCRDALPDCCRDALPDVRGTLVYLELLSQGAVEVHESDCKEPHNSDAHRAQAVRRQTTHTIANARRRDDLSLRTCGFQLFRGSQVPFAPLPQRAGNKGALPAYSQCIEAFVLALAHESTIALGAGDRVHSVTAYNHAVRCSDARSQAQPAVHDRKARATHASTVGKRKSVIADVHSDFTRESGPMVLRSLLCDSTGREAVAPEYREAITELRRRLETDLPSHGGGPAEAILNASDRWRYAFLNVWRSMDREHPVSEWALALLHPRCWSLDGGDHVVKHKSQASFPANYVMRARPACDLPSEGTSCIAEQAVESGYEYGHEWLYYPMMTADEALVFVNYDSDATQPQFVMHGAFNEADEAPPQRGAARKVVEEEEEEEEEPTAAGARGRISVEVRLLVLIESSTQISGRGGWRGDPEAWMGGRQPDAAAATRSSSVGAPPFDLAASTRSSSEGTPPPFDAIFGNEDLLWQIHEQLIRSSTRATAAAQTSRVCKTWRAMLGGWAAAAARIGDGVQQKCDSMCNTNSAVGLARVVEE